MFLYVNILIVRTKNKRKNAVVSAENRRKGFRRKDLFHDHTIKKNKKRLYLHHVKQYINKGVY